MSCRFRRIAAALVVALALPSVASAQGWIDVDRSRPAPPPAGAVTRVASDVRVVVDGRVARVEVEERFRNVGNRVAEGSYLYPLPGEAVFQNFSLWQGEQELKGEMLSADDARTIYEAIVRQQRDPALLTLAGHGLVRAQVFPIQPGETRRVVLRYVVALPRVGDALRFRYAFGARGGLAMSGESVAPTVRVRLSNPAHFGRPYSPTHRISTNTVGNKTDISFAADATGDAELLMPLRSARVGISALTHAVPGERGTFMLLLSPPAVTQAQAVPRALTFVLDVSGSMAGSKMQQAKAALRQAVQGLDARDEFRVIAFSSGVRQFRDGWSRATPDQLDEALRFIDALQAEGGTNIEGALETAFALRPGAERLPLVIFVTDGMPSVGEQQPERLAALAAGGSARTRVFTMGVGQDVNTYLLERLAADGRGAAEFVAPGADVEVAMGTVLGKLRHPAMTNLRIVSSPVTFSAMEPAQLPDLFAGDELVLFGRYAGARTGEVIIEGERNGRRERFAAQLSFPAQASGNEYLPRLWANRRAGAITRSIRLEGSTPERLAELKELALRHGILTEYTSYLVQEPSLVAERDDRMNLGNLRRRTLPSSMAAPPPSAPAAQSGARAFELARTSSARMEASSLSDLAAEVPATASSVRQLHGRTFQKRDSVWTDLQHSDKLPVTRIVAYSDAYFALLRELPELGPLLKSDGDILIAGRSISLQIGRDGTRTWAAGALAATVRAFRGV